MFEAHVMTEDKVLEQVVWCQINSTTLSVRLFGRWSMWIRDNGDNLQWELSLIEGSLKRLVKSGIFRAE